MDLLLDIGRSVGSFSFYRKVATRGLGRAFGHLLVVVLIYSVALTIFANQNVLTEINRFIDWAGSNFPTLTLTNGELSTNAQEPYFADYDNGFLRFVFSTQKAFQDISNLEANTIVVEKKRFVFIGPNREQEVYALQDNPNLPKNISGTIDQKSLQDLKRVLKNFFTPIIFIFSLLFSIFGYLFSTFLYSIVALLVNLFTGSNLKYGALFSICIYALTFLNLVVIAGFFVPFLNFPFRFLILIGATLIFIIGGVLANKKAAA